jgi:hypothetical protein
MKRIVLSPHALDALREREIVEGWIERALRTPERIESDRRHADRTHALLRIRSSAADGSGWCRSRRRTSTT